MNKKNLIFVLFALASFVIVSCDKDDDEIADPSKYMVGVLNFDISPYVLVGDKIELSAYGISKPTNDSITYIWTGSLIGDNDTISGNDSIFGIDTVFIIPNTPGTFELKLIAKAEGYANKEYNKDVIIIDEEGGSLTGIDYGVNFITDDRDDEKYFTTEIGKLKWFSQNLNWKGSDDNPIGAPYGNSEALGHIMGRLYTWNDATGGVSGVGLGTGVQGVCPVGWSVPTNEDWEDLAKTLKGEPVEFEAEWPLLGEMLTVDASVRFNGTRLWPYSPVHTSEDKYNWAALSGGYGNNNYSDYYMLLERGFWWTSTEEDTENANYRYIFYDDPDFPFSTVKKNDFAASVRCVKLI